MFREFIRWVLGPLGGQVLQFYQDYNVIINALVLIYGLIIFYPHYTLIKLINQIERMILEISKTINGSDSLKSLQSELVERWVSEQGARSFFLPTKNDLWFERHSGEEVLNLLQVDRDFLKMTLHKLTGTPPQRDFKALDFKIWEKYRRQLKKGVRGNTPQEVFNLRKQSDGKRR